MDAKPLLLDRAAKVRSQTDVDRATEGFLDDCIDSGMHLPFITYLVLSTNGEACIFQFDEFGEEVARTTTPNYFRSAARWFPVTYFLSDCAGLSARLYLEYDGPDEIRLPAPKLRVVVDNTRPEN